MMMAAALSGAAAWPAAAQVSPHAGVEIATDERRRGVSWSDGRAAPAAWARLDLPAGFDVGVRALATRDDPRHGGADAVMEPTLGYSRDTGPIRLDLFGMAHLFTGGAGPLDYVEGGASASYSLGPAQIAAEARYAPAQTAIGGDNLYLSLRGRVGIPATPVTLTAAVGRSSGTVDDPVRAARLRPAGRYADWSLGAHYVVGPMTLALEYTGTDIDDRGIATSPFAGLRHAGDRLAARVGVSF